MKQEVAARRVFIVEDSQMLRERLEAMLRAIPNTSVIGHASESATAVQAILAHRPDVVVLDIQLSKGNGFDVLREVQKEAPEVRFYVLTNFANDAYRAAAERLGARGFFDKSNDIERLRAALAGTA